MSVIYYIPKELPRSFLNELNLGSVLQVPIKPMKLGRKQQCLDNVQNYLTYNSGSIQYGWIFSMLGSAIIKLHAHVVVKEDSGELLCVTPPEEAMLEYQNFIPDDSVASLIINQRLPTKAFALVKDKVVSKMVELENSSDLARLNGDLFAIEKANLDKLQLATEFMRTVKKHTGRNAPCYCGSGRKNKQCCQ